MKTSWDRLLFLEDSFVVESVKYEFCYESFPIADVLWMDPEGWRRAAVGWAVVNFGPEKGGSGGLGTQLMPWTLTLAGWLLGAASPGPYHPGCRTQPHPSSWHFHAAAQSWGLRNKVLGGGSCTHIFTLFALGVGPVPVRTTGHLWNRSSLESACHWAGKKMSHGSLVNLEVESQDIFIFLLCIMINRDLVMVMLENWRSIWINENQKYTNKMRIKNE